MPIQRMTYFKVKDEGDIPSMIDQYGILERSNRKDGKPYILDVKPRKAVNDPRNAGYNLISITRFASMEDVKYYDAECKAHQNLKAFFKGKYEGPPLVVLVEV